MKRFLVILLFISSSVFCQNSNEVDIVKQKSMLIGKWKFVKTLDQHHQEVQYVYRTYPNGRKMKIVAKGPDIILNADGTYLKTFTPKHVDRGNWRIKSSNEIA